MSDKLRLRIARKDRLGREEVMEFDNTTLPVTHIGGRGRQVLKDGQRFVAVEPPPIVLVDWDKVPDKPKDYIQSQAHDNEPTTFWLCTACGLMVERAESEPLPEGECKHEWVPLDV